MPSFTQCDGEGGGETRGTKCKQTDQQLKLLRTAEEELREKAERRDQDIAILRQMVLAEETLNAPTDDAFLLRFLRARKFDYDRAFKLFQNYYSIRANNPDLFVHFRPTVMKQTFSQNMQMILPHRDQLGRRVFLYRAGKWDPSHCTLDDIFRANLACLESIIHEEETQINGIIAIVDMKDFSMYQARHVKPAYGKKVISLIQDSFPARFKAFHFINNPTVFDLLFTVVKPFLNEKVRNRVFFHGSCFESLHQHIPSGILPDELGGSQPTTDNTAFFNSLIKREEEFVIAVTSYGYGSAKSTAPTRKTEMQWECGELFESTALCGIN